MILERVGYWSNGADGWPVPEECVDIALSFDDRDIVADYVRRGFVARACMGIARCRLCGIPLGSLDLTDGEYIWPEGLDHYVQDHSVRLPPWFIEHVQSYQEAYEDAQVSDALWLTTKDRPR